MDVKIEDGDIAMQSNGELIQISGLDEAVQRVRIAVLTDRGSFVYDRGLGVDYDAMEETDGAAKLDMLIKEAAADIGGVETEVLAYDAESRIVRIKVSYRGRYAVTEVNISGLL